MPTVSDPELDSFYQVIAPYYDLDYEIIFGGQEFYLGLAKEYAGPIMEMGCGTGRVLLPLARAGMAVHGMDCSDAMLERLQANLLLEPADVRQRVSITQGDIRYDDAGQRFPLVISAGNVLHTFLEQDDQLAWFRNVHRHLLPGGAFCFDVFQFDRRYLDYPPEDWIPDVDRMDRITGHRVRRFHRCRHEVEQQRFRVHMRWLVEDSEGQTVTQQTASIMQRWFTPVELRTLLRLSGFRIVDYWGDFSRNPLTPNSPEQIVRAVSAG